MVLRPFLGVRVQGQRVVGRVAQLQALDSMKHDSPLRLLGYFALLESLLTRAPKPTDPYDSITRQVKKKFALPNNRFTRPVDLRQFGPDPDKIWSKMYSYRSALAHGGTADFKQEHAILVGAAQALELLASTTRAVARHALIEPKPLVDLRDC